MRLTVHVAEAKKYKVEKGKEVKTKIFNTLTYNNVNNDQEVSAILKDIETSELGKPVSHVLVGERFSYGRPVKKKK